MRATIAPTIQLLTLALLAGCAPSATPEPVIRVETVVHTVEATHEVTAEVTRLVEVPVTVTPSPTLTLTSTPDYTATPTLTPSVTRKPTLTPTWNPPKVSILAHSACFFGPDREYLFKYGLAATVWMRVIGRTEDGTWLFIKAGDDPDWNGCWIETEKVKFLQGAVSDVPVYWMSLPHSPYYYPPRSYIATRDGNVVTIAFETIWMTEDDYRGYFIEAWVCQGGKQVFEVRGVPAPLPMPPLRENIGAKSATFIDEPGCSQPSSARLYAVEKHGYTNYQIITWPAHEAVEPTLPTPTSTPTPTP